MTSQQLALYTWEPNMYRRVRNQQGLRPWNDEEALIFRQRMVMVKKIIVKYNLNSFYN